ncbi:uncharacterized protein LOC105442617 [Strongylocentrotus purpuratus]|uniref:Uncharacterized protein n=1 Tax=Strongylocentrotus purpuratus TaxID=7668 RepID=A0A7M7T2N8_STRPU|nr:uncharacterized protein LOC105442617 [Strongylocentrotus purpuratus]
MASEYKQFINEGCDVEGGGYDNLPSYDESNAISGSAPPQNPYPPPNSSGYPMQQPSKSQQASQFPQQQPATAVPQPQVIQVPMEQNIVHANMETMPNDYFGSALFVTMCCCLPFGIVALIKSTEVYMMDYLTRLNKPCDLGQFPYQTIMNMHVSERPMRRMFIALGKTRA